MRFAFLLALFILSALATSEKSQGDSPEIFSASELAFIKSHGPWPVETTVDPSNRFSGNPDAIVWGQSLFHDTRLSREGKISCASCHLRDLSFADGRSTSRGVGKVDRNAIALANLRLNRWYGWDGQSDNLWAQSIHPILDQREMNATTDIIAERIKNQDDLQTNYKSLVGISPLDQTADTILVNVAKALAAYQETIQTPASQFDRLRKDILAKQTTSVDASLLNGLKLFVGKGKCSFCHFGPNFTNGEFHDIGLPFFKEDGGVDSGRFGGIQALKASPYNRLGSFSDEPQDQAVESPASFVRLQHRNWGEFRVPALRNVARTAPYMHNGSLETLEEVVRHYSTVNPDRLHADGEILLQPLNLTEQEIRDLVAFLEIL